MIQHPKQFPTRHFEDLSQQPVAGIDEAGCGPWAGPLVAAAVILPLNKNFSNTYFEDLRDSKLLTHNTRYRLFCELTQDSDVRYGVGVVSVPEIDAHLLRGALPLVYKRAVDNLGVVPSSILMDGIRDPKLNLPTKLLKHGDRISISIAAASIIAKVIRDKLMDELHEQYPHYAWNTNKGYGTAVHKNALSLMGISPHHRKSYKPIQQYL